MWYAQHISDMSITFVGVDLFVNFCRYLTYLYRRHVTDLTVFPPLETSTEAIGTTIRIHNTTIEYSTYSKNSSQTDLDGCL